MIRMMRHINSLVAAGSVASVALRALTRWRRRMSFEGKAVLITGGARGLGLALARELAAEGARLAIVARDLLELEQAARDLQGAQVIAIQRDLTQSGEVPQAVREAARALGGLDVLINNAGTIDVGPFETMTSADFQRSMAIHLWAPISAMNAALPWLSANRGRVVNIASIGGLVAVPHLAPYCASKFALVGASDALRAEFRRHGVYVTTVCPGLMRTGSHVNAHFHGAHQKEYAWFSVGAALGSVSAERAARQIVSACRYGQPHLTISAPARIVALANTLLPNLVAEVVALVGRALPKPPRGRLAWERHSGWESRGLIPKVITRRADREIEPHNQIPSRAGNGRRH
jgi:NAD(P)-dependent dehydrogenase (short-subunit alcohol dehydrogenase family)